jgi:hypothetical protein
MSFRVVGWAVACAIAAVAPAVAEAQCNCGYGYDRGYGYDAGYGGGGYGYGGGDGDGYGYGYGSSPDAAPAHYCEEHLEYHQRQAYLNQMAPYRDWYGYGGPEGWQRAMEEDHARFHYTHPGSWRCEYQGWPSG